MDRILASWRYCALGVIVAIAAACADDATRLTGPNPETTDGGLPRLKAGGSALVLIPGGTVPAVPAVWDANFAAVVRASRASTAKIRTKVASVASSRSPAPHLEQVLLEHSVTGARALWVVSRGAIVNSASLGTMPTTWEITGAGDFNSDNMEDILWQNTADGSRAVWLMNGSGVVIKAVSFGVVPVEWHMAGAGDYNSDGKDDILWEHRNDGSRVLWIMNGTGGVQFTVLMGVLATEWKMKGANDYDSDGEDDVLLENSVSGLKALWVMNGQGGVRGSVTLGTLPTEWRLVGGGDLDGDYHEDVVYENTTNGTRAVWLENGFAKVISAPVLTVLPTEWKMTAVLKGDLGDRSGAWIALGQTGAQEVNCAIRTGGVAYCWGNHTNRGSLGLNHFDPLNSPTPLPVSTRVRFSEISVGEFVSCGIDLDFSAHCWGNRAVSAALLGNGVSGGSPAPTRVTMPPGVFFSRISTNYGHSCALSTAGQIYCWGANGFGQLGTNDVNPRSVPSLVSAGIGFTAVATGRERTCAIATGGGVYCWGLGDGLRSTSSVPVGVPLPAPVIQIALGHAHVCALGFSGSVYCWGSNQYGELGIPVGAATTTATTISPPSGVTFSQIGAGDLNTCALTTAGGAYCWGQNEFGTFGNGTRSSAHNPTPTPVSVPAGVRFTRLMLGGWDSACALTSTSAIYCWGFDTSGQVGRGGAWVGVSNVLSPSLVVDPKVIVAQ